MNAAVDNWSQVISELNSALLRLEAEAASLHLLPLEKREWFELLQRKLRPQLGRSPFLVVAVVGGTNIGKSVVFNHLAGGPVSAVSPLASGTRHPSAVLTPELAGKVNLESLFPGFAVEAWSDAQKTLVADATHRLFYRLNEQAPPNLIILDTPDIDSVEQVNWERADYLRQSADVLVAVLTQQKYNDAAVKEFFRKAAQEGKLVIIVFNQCLLPDDEAYWPLWVKTFCDETGIQPHLLYLAPYDRRAAESQQLPFYERQWPPSGGAGEGDLESRNLLSELSQLRFEEIKVQAMSGALQHLVDPSQGIPSWLREISDRSQEFEEALKLMAGGKLVEVDRWPTLPNSVFIEQIRHWWGRQRVGWTASVHGFYNRFGQLLSVPVQAILNRGQPQVSPLERYRHQEWDAILEVIESSLKRLSWLKDLGNPLLSPRLEKVLDGNSRARLIEQLRAAHDQIDFEAEVSGLIETQLQQFRQDRPDAYQLFRRIDSVAAASRPAISLALFMTGIGPLGDVIAPMFADTAIQGALHVAGETVGGTVITVVGDKVITDAAAQGTGYLETKFRQLHAAFAKSRADWLIAQLEKHLLGDFSHELAESARLSHSEAYQQVSRLVRDILEQLTQATGRQPTL